MPRIRIVVLKRVLHDDLIREKLPEAVVPHVTICPEFEEGQVFVAESLDQKPGGFCQAAWTDIVNKIGPQLEESPAKAEGLRSNSQAAQSKTLAAQSETEQPFFLSCMDGLRPVTFEVTPLAE